jgi:hypothetical protein
MTFYRCSLSTVRPDNVCRVLWRAHAAVIWDDDPTRITFQFRDCRAEVFVHPCPALLISGSTDVAVQGAVDQLGYHTIDRTIIKIRNGDSGGKRDMVAGPWTGWKFDAAATTACDDIGSAPFTAQPVIYPGRPPRHEADIRSAEGRIAMRVHRGSA